MFNFAISTFWIEETVHLDFTTLNFTLLSEFLKNQKTKTKEKKDKKNI